MSSELARAVAPDGAELVLYERDGTYTLRADGYELMTSREHRSEDLLALETLQGLSLPNPRVLVGGLGFGFTARAALQVLPSSAHVTVAEVSPEVVLWNQTHLASLWPPRRDERLEVRVGDVATFLSVGRFDAILLDVDNGPSPLVRAHNGRLYSREGLQRIHDALSPDGRLGVWSAVDDAQFEARMGSAGLTVDSRTVHVGHATHRLFLGYRVG